MALSETDKGTSQRVNSILKMCLWKKFKITTKTIRLSVLQSQYLVVLSDEATLE